MSARVLRNPVPPLRALPMPGRRLVLWAALPAWLLAFWAAALMEHAPFASVWFPPTAVTFAALTLFGLRGWMPVALAALLSQLWTLHRLGIAPDALTFGIGGFGFAVTHTLPFVLLTRALRWQVRRDPLGRFGPSTLFIFLGGGVLACGAAAVGGNAVLVASGLAPALDFRTLIIPWMIGDYAGLLALGPLLVEVGRTWGRGRPEETRDLRRFPGSLLLLLGTIGLVLWMAGLQPDDPTPLYALVFALAVQQWISHTQPPVLTLLALGLTSGLIAALTALFGLGAHALLLQFALIALALTTYSALSFLSLRDDHRRLSQLLATDPLTKAASRAHFAAVTEASIASAHTDRRALSVLMLDLDHLKAINDAGGHAAGDDALQRFAHICRDHLRDDDLLGRLGGDEFALCLPGVDAGGAQVRARALLAAFAAASRDDRPLAASVGIAQLLPAEDYGRLLERADGALLEAKRSGRARVVVA